MVTIKGNILTTNGNLQPKARTMIAQRVENDFDDANFEKVGDGVWVRKFQTLDGTIVYATLKLNVSLKDPSIAEEPKARIGIKFE